MKATLKALIVVALVCSACGGKKSMTQGKVTGDHVACKPTEMHGRFDCASPLRDYLHANPAARIAGVNVIRGDGRDELLIWRTESTAWPKASTLEVDNHECTPATGNDPDCATVIDDLTDPKLAKHHYFIVPVYGAPDQPAHPGSWSVLDVRAVAPGASSDAGWDSARTELVRCQLGPGEPYRADLGDGVMRAQAAGSAGPRGTSVSPISCEPALINYLRAHPEQRVMGVVAVDGVVTKRIGDKDELTDPGTISLMVLIGSTPWPTSASLSITDLACVQGNCVPHYADFRPELKVSPRILFTAPIYDAQLDEAGAGSLLFISIIE